MRPGRDGLGGTDGNERLTGATAAVLTLLLIAEGVTILFLGGLLGAHMFIGLLLIPPVLLKLGSTGYRFARYYTHAGPYREKGPPPLVLRLLAPALVAATVVVFASGVALLILGHRSNLLLLVHKASFVVWGASFAAHFLGHLPALARLLPPGPAPVRARRLPGARARRALLAGAILGGLALALMLTGPISHWVAGAG